MAIWHRRSSASPEGTSRKAAPHRPPKGGAEAATSSSRRSSSSSRGTCSLSPQLISIIPNAGDFLDLTGTDVRDQEFREFTLRFDEGQTIEETLGAERRHPGLSSGGDGVFGNGNDIDVTPTPFSRTASSASATGPTKSWFAFPIICPTISTKSASSAPARSRLRNVL